MEWFCPSQTHADKESVAGQGMCYGFQWQRCCSCYPTQDLYDGLRKKQCHKTLPAPCWCPVCNSRQIKKKIGTLQSVMACGNTKFQELPALSRLYFTSLQMLILPQVTSMCWVRDLHRVVSNIQLIFGRPLLIPQPRFPISTKAM